MKSKILILALILTSLFSCKVSNTSLVAINSSDLAGTWTIKNITMDDAVLNVTDPVNITLTGKGFGKNFNTNITFSENPNRVTMTGDFVFELTYTEPSGVEKTESLIFDNIFFNDNFGFTTSSWALDDNTLQLNESGENLTINVISYVDNVLTIETDVNKSITLDGVTSTVVGKATINIQK
ncbi:hypothetical protein [Polaribacter sp. R77954]|uniref:hypothetical protein n=1 Tax=Polaribacter sp. R77954 TaxID=3093870 RepID=UPI0037CB5E10